jgi:hypothetical protein
LIAGPEIFLPKEPARLGHPLRGKPQPSRELSHSFNGAPQYACYGSWIPAEIRHKPIQVLFTLNEPLIRVAVVANPEQDVEIACVLRFAGGEKGYVDFVELHQFRGV